MLEQIAWIAGIAVVGFLSVPLTILVLRKLNLFP